MRLTLTKRSAFSWFLLFAILLPSVGEVSYLMIAIAGKFDFSIRVAVL